MDKKHLIIGGVIVLLIMALLIPITMVAAYLLMPDLSIEEGNIAMISINEPLQLNTGPTGPFDTKELSVRDYIDALDMAEKDPNIKAIILKINCPGGEVIASEKLARKVKEASKKKPVVAYVETIGASGGYMIIAPANYIVAEKHSLVGSIGVRMDMLQYYDLMDKLGINATVIKAGKYKDIGSPYRPITREERECLENMVDEIYMDFVKWVAENRNMSVNKTLEIADGKIYSGNDAKKVGLVDYVGSEEDAINITMEIANISNPEIVEYTPLKLEGFFSLLSNMIYNLGYGIGTGISENSKNIGVFNY
ncbi:signal peptide peptidase SppA [Methanothermococcus sp. SCGC AD-155-M21]|nr:signal peptide peptidase SppA [Methanothermococcus sp. SCGC AD-155-M21]